MDFGVGYVLRVSSWISFARVLAKFQSHHLGIFLSSNCPPPQHTHVHTHTHCDRDRTLLTMIYPQRVWQVALRHQFFFLDCSLLSYCPLIVLEVRCVQNMHQQWTHAYTCKKKYKILLKEDIIQSKMAIQIWSFLLSRKSSHHSKLSLWHNTRYRGCSWQLSLIFVGTTYLGGLSIKFGDLQTLCISRHVGFHVTLASIL